MNQALQVFSYENAEVRTVIKDGEPWFVAADVCGVLEVSKHRDAVSRLDSDERESVLVDTPGGKQEMTAVNESGLYSLIMTSRKPEAKKFKKWVTAEVLPTIRKTGSYGADPLAALEDPAAMRTLLLSYSEKVIQRDKLIADLSPKAAAHDRLSDAEGSLCLRDAAKALQMQPTKFNQSLQAAGWIYRRPGKGSFIAYQEKIQRGYLVHNVTPIPTEAEGDKISEQVRVTPKGMARLAVMMGAQEAA